MLTYTIEHIRGSKNRVRKTLYFEGMVDSSQTEKLNRIIFDAIAISDYLVVDISRVEVFDHSLTVLIRSRQETAKRLGKRLTVRGWPKIQIP